MLLDQEVRTSILINLKQARIQELVDKVKTLLKSFENANEYLILENMERTIRPVGQKSVGWYKIVGGHPRTLVVQDSKLFLTYKDKKVSIDANTMSKTSEIGENLSSFELIKTGNTQISFTYEHDKSLISVEPFDYIDAEDFDWGLFLSNIINNKSRKAALIERLSN